LLVQTHQRWECIVVDDGSDDRPERVVEAVDDDRVRFVRLEENRGRGAARQVALEHARGEFLGALDVGDWVYPEKLEIQLAWMKREADLVLVSSGVAIVGGPGELLGCRGPGEMATAPAGPFRGLRPMSFAYAPALIHMEPAKAAGFDATFRRSEDLDFLLRLLQGRQYRVLPRLTVAYAEEQSYRKEQLLSGLRHRRMVMQKHRRAYPLRSRYHSVGARMKSLAYRLAFATGTIEPLIRRRSRAPSPSERRAFHDAFRKVEASRRKIDCSLLSCQGE
jgi:glycosyltransferase involved in cell wall biosynthesis